MRLPRVPTLDEIAAEPELVKGLPRELAFQLSLKAQAVQFACALAMVDGPQPAVTPTEDRALLDVAEAARRLGMAKGTLYRLSTGAPYRDMIVRTGTRNLRFSAQAIAAFLQRRTGL